MYEPVTYNLKDFGYYELAEAADLLTALKLGRYSGHCDERMSEVSRIGFNRNSGKVWLEDEDYQTFMVDDEGRLYQFYYLGYAGTEGSAEDLWEEFKDGNIDENDLEELADIFENEGMDGRAEDVRVKMMESEN